MLTVKVDGIDRVLSLVDDLKDVEKDKAIRSGLRAAGRIFRTGGLSNLKSRMLGVNAKRGLYRSRQRRATGSLVDAIKVKVKKNKPGVLVGSNPDIAWYGHLVDMGTTDRYGRGTFKRRAKFSGRMKGNNFWTDSKTQNETQAVNTMYDAVKRAVQKIKDKK